MAKPFTRGKLNKYSFLRRIKMKKEYNQVYVELIEIVSCDVLSTSGLFNGWKDGVDYGSDDIY